MRQSIHYILLVILFSILFSLYYFLGQQLETEYPQYGRSEMGQFKFRFISKRYGDFTAVDVLPVQNRTTFEERMTCTECKLPFFGKPRLILDLAVDEKSNYLAGCPDWHCEVSSDMGRADEAAVVILQENNFKRSRQDQLLVFYSQESPFYNPLDVVENGYFNLSLGYRHDTAGTSPYGYVVKLADESRPIGEVIDMTLIKGKTKPVVWFVSHCETHSRRELIVDELKKHIPVDIVGTCGGNRTCRHNAECENMLDTDYFFYLAFENTICTDYITEKAWRHGYTHNIVPIVLKRSIVEGRLPPNSFLAVDDFETIQELAIRLKALIENKEAYSAYFDWRREYKVVFLAENRDYTERPWGFCQLCRMAWQKPRRQHVIRDFKSWWHDSCAKPNDFVQKYFSKVPRSGLFFDDASDGNYTEYPYLPDESENTNDTVLVTDQEKEYVVLQ